MPRKIYFTKGDRLLVCRTDRIGDLILTLPLIESLKKRFPECMIEVMASEYAAPVLYENPAISRIHEVNPERLKTDQGYFEKKANDLRQNRIRAALLIYPEKTVSRLIKKGGIRIRIGTARRFHSYLYNYHLWHSRKKSNRHESEYNLDYLQFFPEGPTVSVPRVLINDRERKEAGRIISKVCGGKELVVIHPGSGGSAHDWPLESFAELYKDLEERDINVILTGSREEQKMIESISNKIGRKITSIAGETGLRTLAAVLEKTELVIANSTGPLHLAAAVGTAVVGLYPNHPVMSPRRWGPLGEHHIVITPDGSQPMSTISPSEVSRAVISRLRGGR